MQKNMKQKSSLSNKLFIYDIFIHLNFTTSEW